MSFGADSEGAPYMGSNWFYVRYVRFQDMKGFKGKHHKFKLNPKAANEVISK